MALDSSSAEGPKPAERHQGAFQNTGVRPSSSLGKTLGIFLADDISETCEHSPNRCDCGQAADP